MFQEELTRVIRQERFRAREQMKELRRSQILELRRKGFGTAIIAEILEIPESSVRFVK